MVNSRLVVNALKQLSVPIFWLHGHIHFPWRYQSPTVPNLVYLNPGSPLLKRREGITYGRWVLEWNGTEMKTEWRSSPHLKNALLDLS